MIYTGWLNLSPMESYMYWQRISDQFPGNCFRCNTQGTASPCCLIYNHNASSFDWMWIVVPWPSSWVPGIKVKKNRVIIQPRPNKALCRGVWRTVSKFPTFGRLDESVEKHLLPKMDEYLQSISDAELVSQTRDLLIKYGGWSMGDSSRGTLCASSVWRKMPMHLSSVIPTSNCEDASNAMLLRDYSIELIFEPKVTAPQEIEN